MPVPLPPVPSLPLHLGALDPRVLTGHRVVTTQSLAAAMALNGQQFIATALIPSVPSGDEVFFSLQTPPDIIRVSSITFDGQYVNARFEFYRDGVATGGTVVPTYNNNLNSGNVSAAVFKAGVAVSNIGVQASEITYLIGNEGNGDLLYGSI